MVEVLAFQIMIDIDLIKKLEIKIFNIPDILFKLAGHLLKTNSRAILEIITYIGFSI